jgi:hypothetical protein
VTEPRYESESRALAFGWSTWITRRSAPAGRFPTSASWGPYWTLTLNGAIAKARRVVARDIRRRNRELLFHRVTDEELRRFIESVDRGTEG